MKVTAKLFDTCQASFPLFVRKSVYPLLLTVLAAVLFCVPSAMGAQKFNLNNRVQANADCNVRAAASISGNLLFLQGIGSIGTVIGGPSTNSGYIWYNIDWDNTTTNGWTADYLLDLSPPVTLSPGNSSLPGPTLNTLAPQFQWQSVHGATGYGLYIRDLTVSGTPLVYPNVSGTTVTPITSTSATLPSGYLVAGHSYKWNVTSFSGTNEYVPLSSPFSRWFVTGTIPNAPSTISAFGGTIGVGLGWNDNSSNEQGFRLERRNGASGSWLLIATLGINEAGYSDTNVSSGIAYFYRVYAFNGIGNSATNSTTSGVFFTPSLSLSVNNPNSGSPLSACNSYSIAWTTTGNTASISYFKFGYSLNGGNTFTDLSDQISSSSSAYSWTPHALRSTQARVRVLAYNSSNQLIVGATNSSNFAITIPNGNPTANPATLNNSPKSGSSVQFYGYNSTSSGNCSEITGYSWSFADGTTSSSINPIHTFYPANGSTTYYVTLTVTDANGQNDQKILPIYVSGQSLGAMPQSSFSIDPVNLATGNYIYEHSDLRLPGKGFPFEFARFYNSKFSEQSGLPVGFGWTHSYNIRLAVTATNATVTFGDSHSETHILSGGQYIPETGIYDVLTNNPDGSFTLTGKDQTRRNFDGQGRLTSISDKNANTLSLTYSNGVLAIIADTSGRQIVFQSDANGLISQITDPLNRVIQFQYDGQTNLVAVIDANNGTNRYSYDTNHQMTAAFDPRGTKYVENFYDDLQRVVSYQTDAYTNGTSFNYDFINYVTYVTNALGKISIHRHDDRLLITNIVDEAGSQQSFAYDTNRNRTLVQDKNGNQTRYGYDSRGNVTNKTDALTNITSIEYNSLNNPTRRIDALTNVTSFGYDSRGNITSTTNALSFVSRVQYDASGLPIVLTDARGFSTTNNFDPQGNLSAVIDAKGFTNRFEHDLVGRKIRQIDALNRTNSFVFDNNDNLTFTTNALGFVNTFTYDANKNRITAQNPRGAVTTNVFDLKDRLVATLAPISQTNGASFDALDRKIASFDAFGSPTRYGFDDIGNLIAVTNALKQVTRFTFDPQGNQTSTIDPTGHYLTNFFDVLNRKTATIDISISTNLTQYDALGRVIATTNASGQITRFNYDSIGRLTNVVDAANQSVIFGYDGNGNRVRLTDPNSHTWTNIFDELNRPTEQRNPDGTKTVFQFDPVGNVTNKVTPNGDSIRYSYDSLNRLTKIAYPSGTPVTFAYDSVGNRTNMTDSLGTTAWQFDLLNRSTSVTDPYGQIVINGFDVNGNRVSLTYSGSNVVTYGFDALNRMTALTNWLGGVVSYGFDTRGNMTAITNANGTGVSYVHDVASRLVALTNATFSAGVIAAYALTLDGVGNHQQSAQEQPIFPILPSQTNTYAYSSDNRLILLDNQTVTHNSNGDLTSIGTNTYAYDFEDRLVQFALSDVSGTCGYDGLGNRLGRTANGQSRRFVLDRLGTLTQVLVETDTNNAAVSFYVYGAGLAQRITPGGQVVTYHFNLQGSTVALTDSGGNVTDAYAYDSFGVLANADGNSAQPFRYLGRYGIIDDSTGLYHARARYFSPLLGRFITKDPLTGKDGDGQSLNRYVYALNRPLSFQDASGLTARDFDRSSFRVANSTPAFVFVSRTPGLRISGNYANSTMAVCTDCGGISIIDAISLGLLIVDVLDTPLSPGPDTALLAVELQTGRIAARGGIGPVRQGQAGVARAIAEYEAAGGQVFGTEISLRAGGGLTRTDIYGQSAQGIREFIEVKNGAGAALNPNQARLFPMVEQSGAVPVGANAARAGLTPGVPIPPTPVRVIMYP